jgi:hypothetical protein
MPLPGQLIAVLLFVLAVFAATLHGLAASGHFPLSGDNAKPAFPPGRATLFGSIVLTLVALIIGVIEALCLITWSTAIIAGGLALLIAPLVLRVFPDRFVDGAGALVVFAGVTVAAAAFLIWFAA